MLRISHVVAMTALVAGLAVAGAASAGPGEGRHDGPPRHFGGQIDFRAIDADTNGSLSRAELMDRATSRIATADTNGDGSLDRAELAAAMPAPHGALIAVFSQSPAERIADRILAETGNTESGSATVEVLAERQVNMLLARADSDRDAAISEAEVEEMRPPHGPRDRGRGERHGDGGRDGEHSDDGPGEMRRGAMEPEAPMPPVEPGAPAPADNG